VVTWPDRARPDDLAADVSAAAGRHRADGSYVRCDREGDRVVLAFPYDLAMVTGAKAISGRSFDWTTKTNLYPFAQLPQVLAFAEAHGIEVTPQVRALVSVAAGLARQELNHGQAIRDAAHLYLSHRLLPVPAWAATPEGSCCCPRGTDCARPGKHPRSVHIGPGRHDYSWKPLVCTAHDEVEQRFGSDGGYAAANLMLAIPEGILAIDQDYDDGGRHALARLAGQLGELPATLHHRTPHGKHRIYRTPAGWTTRAWVGKDSRNPLPPGIDLRVPGQILMAPPSRVPGPHGLVSYGPITGTDVADLPAAYIDAWTPPAEQTRVARPPVPVPAVRADVAAAYVHARITGIAEDLAGLKPGGRNTAIYTAALKVGSTLGAARLTPGADHAVAAWTDQAAETALMTAAEQNGYIADHSAAAAQSAIRSGLRNGLSNPRPLPDIGAGHQTLRSAPQGQRAPQELCASGPAAEPCDQAQLPRGNRGQTGIRDWRETGIYKDQKRQPIPAAPSCERVVTADVPGIDVGG
jgi:Bifunctional DNA primase/polymerase, N-terminal